MMFHVSLQGCTWCTVEFFHDFFFLAVILGVQSWVHHPQRSAPDRMLELGINSGAAKAMRVTCWLVGWLDLMLMVQKSCW